MKLVFNDIRTVEFVGKLTGATWLQPGTIGVEQDGEIIAGFVASDCQPGIDVMCSIAGLKGHNWASRRFFRAIFRYIFVQMNLRRCTALVDITNHASKRLVERLGYKREGILRERGAYGVDAIVYGMLKRECRWLDKKE